MSKVKPQPDSAASAWRRICLRYLVAMLVGSLVWETLQLPFYTLSQTGTAQYILYAVAHCTVGDLMIAATALCIAILLAGRGWPWRNYRRVASLAILFGLAYTVFSEWLNVSVRESWAYAAAMPILPGLGTGLSPFLQWIVVPAAAFFWAQKKSKYGDIAGHRRVDWHSAFGTRSYEQRSHAQGSDEKRRFRADKNETNLR